MGLIKFNKDAPINEIIGLLHSFDKVELAKLKNEYPEYDKLLKPGIDLGVDEVKDEELKVRATICKTGLNLILKESEKIIPKIKSRLKLLNNLQFLSQIVVAISGASILVFLQEKHEVVKIAIGLLTLVAALLTLFVQHRSGTIALGENSLSKIFNYLTDYKLKAEHFLDELKIIEELNFSASREKVSEIIKESNGISLEMKKIIRKY